MKNYLAGFTILASILLILVVDLFIVTKWGYNYSVSQFMHWLALNFPVAYLLIGIVLGHFCWGISSEENK